MSEGAAERIYLDHAASAPLLAQAREAMAHAERHFANPSSVHASGVAARVELERYRSIVAAHLQCRREEVIFTSGGSESNTLAIIGRMLWWLNSTGRLEMPVGKRPHLVVSALEHSSVLEAARGCQRLGAELTLVAPGSDGVVDVEEMLGRLRESTILLAMQHANNETGVVQPVGELMAALACLTTAPLVLIDAVQTMGVLGCPDAGGALVALSAHKIGGPRGIGALRIPEGSPVLGLIRGGGQEHGLRAGTENLAGIAGLAAALGHVVRGRAERARRSAAGVRMLDSVFTSLGGWVRTSQAPALPGTLSGRFEGVRADALLTAASMRGVDLSTGSACHASSERPSHVLRAMGLSDADCRATVRLSLSGTESDETIDRAARIVADEVKRLRRFADRGVA